MKHHCSLGYGLQFLTFFISFCLAKQEGVCKAGEQGIGSQHFYVSYTDIVRLERNIISESRVNSWTDCGTSCLENRFCVAYNYKENSKGNEINCQLSATSDHWFEKGRKGDNGWSFYKGTGKKKVPCNDESGCENGRMIPFKCESFDGYERELCEKNGVEAYRFRGKNIEKYGVVNGSAESLTSFTVSFWVNISDDSAGGILSHAYKCDGNCHNGIYIEMNSGLEFYYTLKDNTKYAGKRTGISLANFGKFRHACFTWHSSDGQLKVYVDGSFAQALTIKGTAVPGGGVWVIGQDQDNVGGKFQAHQAFVGELTKLHVWNRVLSHAEIKDLASSCASDMKGNYIAFGDFEIKGNVERFKLSCC